MNSEELELSLRAEFENYLKDVVAAMREDVADFQRNFESEFEKHKSQMDDAFRNLSSRFNSAREFDQAFTESVVEHLRLARDDGAKLTAQAFSDAQELEQPAGNYDQLRDAINDISSQPNQSAILKSLVDHASQFAPRGAFFILKHENFVCWRRFDGHSQTEDETVRNVHFPLAADTLLADAIQTLDTRDSSSSQHGDDATYLDSLGFGRPDRMFAVPLIARGRGVAVLYLDGDGSVNLEAIESMVRVAGLTVELRAAAAASQTPAASEPPSYVPMPAPDDSVESESEVADAGHTAIAESQPEEHYEVEAQPDEHEYSGEVSVEETHAEYESSQEGESATEEPSFDEPVSEAEVAVEAEPEYTAAEVTESPEPVSDFAFASSDAYDASAVVPEPSPVEEYAYSSDSPVSNGHAFESAPDPVVEVATVQPSRSRLSDRNVDLPIDVTDEERRLHNDARRFARLLVSEIKLYNEQKVMEGRDSGDLYERLREAIDRSREMYDKRVKPEVAAKFDYFHFELVSNLAEGNDTKLGSSYPGATA